ncbi:MAG: TIGR00266 family protein [Candidatus Bathyarchaeota archaeon]
MEYEIKYKPSYSMLVVKLGPNESITAEAGAMTYMDPNIDVQTRRREKSILGTLGLKLIGGQSFFVNDYRAQQGLGEVAFVSAPVGDIETLEVKPNQGYIVQRSSYIASTQNVDLDVKWQGFTKGLFGQGLFMIKVSGDGSLFINTFGAIDKHTLKSGETLIVDNFHLVAFSDTCDYKVKKFGGLKSTLLGGEGLVTEIRGPGDVYIQTKNLREFVEWLWTLLEPRVRSRAR